MCPGFEGVGLLDSRCLQLPKEAHCSGVTQPNSGGRCSTSSRPAGPSGRSPRPRHQRADDLRLAPTATDRHRPDCPVSTVGAGRTRRCPTPDRRVGGRTGHPPPCGRADREGGVPKRRFEAIAVMAAEGLPVQLAAASAERLRVRATTPGASARPRPRSLRHAWLTEAIATSPHRLHTASTAPGACTPSSPWGTASRSVSHGAVELLMRRRRLQGPARQQAPRPAARTPTDRDRSGRPPVRPRRPRQAVGH